jgi:hypothetical protein
VKRVGQDVSGDLRNSVGEAFLDSRYELTATVARLGGGQNPELKKVDEAFWDKFQAVSSGRELEVQRCYQK